MITRRRLAISSLALLAALLAIIAFAYATATADPVVRRARVRLAGWPAGAPPVRLLLVSDIHVAGPDMPPERLARIVARINALGPDLVLLAGDFVSDKRSATRLYPVAEALAPLSGIEARTIAVLGNHDHWRSAAGTRAALARAGITLLRNDAVSAGPLTIGGLDDDFTRRADVPATLAAMRRLPGARLILSHSPDPFPDIPSDVGLVLAGHTHCGQIRLPWIGGLDHVRSWRPLRLRPHRGGRQDADRRRGRGHQHRAAAPRRGARHVADRARPALVQGTAGPSTRLTAPTPPGERHVARAGLPGSRRPSDRHSGRGRRARLRLLDAPGS